MLKKARMNVLRSSSGSAATLPKNRCQPSAWNRVLLDVRQIERRDRFVVLAEVRADGAQRLVAREVTRERDDQVVAVHVAQRSIVLFRREVGVVVAVPIGLHHQVGVGREPAAAELVRGNE